MEEIIKKLRESSAAGFCYILHSEKDGGIYIGSTRNLIKRFIAHKNGKVKSTKSRRPLRIKYYEEFVSYSDARKREIFLKSGTGRDWIKKNL